MKCIPQIYGISRDQSGLERGRPPKREKESQRKKDGSAPIVTVSLRSREINSLA